MVLRFKRGLPVVSWSILPAFFLALTAAAPVDRFGIAKLYPSLSGGREWVSKGDDGAARTLVSGARDPHDDEFIVRGNGKVIIDGAGIAAMVGDAPRMYVYDEPRRKKWLNVEVTFYCMRIAETPAVLSYRGFGCGTRSDHQDAADKAEGDKGPCKGPTYYGKFVYDGRVVFHNEIIHHSEVGYSVNRPEEG